MAYEYREYENRIFRGRLSTKGRINGPLAEVAVGGQWVRASPDDSLDARLEGAQMTEEEAREFQGDDWPADDDAPGDATT